MCIYMYVDINTTSIFTKAYHEFRDSSQLKFQRKFYNVSWDEKVIA